MTIAQQQVLMELTSRPRTTSFVAKMLGGTETGWTYDRVHGILRRLEEYNYVRRVDDNPIQWELTREGRFQLEQSLART